MVKCEKVTVKQNSKAKKKKFPEVSLYIHKLMDISCNTALRYDAVSPQCNKFRILQNNWVSRLAAVFIFSVAICKYCGIKYLN